MLDMDKRELENEEVIKENNIITEDLENDDYSIDEEIEDDFEDDELDKAKENEILLNLADDEIFRRLTGVIEPPTRTLKIDRVKIPITIKAFTEKEITNIRKKCTKTRKLKNGLTEEKVDDDLMNLMLLERGITKPNFNNKRFLEENKFSNAREALKRLFLAGELQAIADEILKLSRYDEVLEEIEIKN
ncbi:conserved hypothetical protein [Clostridioides difficile CD002]|uniref:phage tail assembly chaperone n=1 Tax=Clostridioides difficile TaxID=1496 RepID=UPI0003B2A2DF|nr:hypothetical protein [Clostridioides difficile]CCL06433.1 conserved hypothetical protein [Clostridioides difficile CD002]